MPVSAPAGSGLSKFAAISPSAIWAMGETYYGGNTGPGESPPPMSHTLIEHWNGTRWTHVASPDLLPSMRNKLQDMAVIAPNDVWAVGVAGSIGKSGYGPGSSPLLEHWDGARWRLVQLPAIQNAGLDSVVALNANDIWAAGGISTNGNDEYPLLMHWNGQSWSQVASQAINNGEQGRLLKIAADASHNLWALGFDRNGISFLLSLNNGKWTPFPMPNPVPASSPASAYNQFRGLSITNAQDIWLAGDTASTPLAEHWDGHQWQAVPGRYQGQPNLQAIFVSSGIVWISGFDTSTFQPFIATTCK